MTTETAADNPVVLEEAFWQLLLAEREATLGRLRQVEDALLAAGRIERRAVVSSRQMKALERAFGEDEVRQLLME